MRELARQLDKQLVYDRHLVGIAEDVHKVVAALGRRSAWVQNGGSHPQADGETFMSPRSLINAMWTSPRPNRQ